MPRQKNIPHQRKHRPSKEEEPERVEKSDDSDNRTSCNEDKEKEPSKKKSRPTRSSLKKNIKYMRLIIIC